MTRGSEGLSTDTVDLLMTTGVTGVFVSRTGHLYARSPRSDETARPELLVGQETFDPPLTVQEHGLVAAALLAARQNIPQ